MKPRFIERPVKDTALWQRGVLLPIRPTGSACSARQKPSGCNREMRAAFDRLTMEREHFLPHTGNSNAPTGGVRTSAAS